MDSLSLRWSNDHPDPCPFCDPWVGTVWAIDDPARPTLPGHINCRCYWQSSDAAPNRPGWADIPAVSRDLWLSWLAWLLRNGRPIPPFLEGLRPYARGGELMSEMLQALSSGRLVQRGGRREWRARLIQAGQIRMANDRPGNIVVMAEALSAAVAAGAFNGLAVFADHPQASDPHSVRALVGVTHSAAYDAASESVTAVIRFYNTDNEQADGRLANVIVDTLDMMAADGQAGLLPPDVGLSLLFYPQFQRGRGDAVKQLVGFEKIVSADVVFTPAANGRFIQALSARWMGGAGENRMDEDDVVEEVEAVADTSTTTVNVSRAGGGGQANLSAGLSRNGNGNAATAVASQTGNISQWQRAVAQTAIPALLAAADLPQPSRERLAAQQYNTPEELEAAIAQEREYLARLVEERVILVGGHAPRGPHITGMRTGLDVARNAVDWLFGVEGAELPPPALRSVDVFYTMLTGDNDFHGVAYQDRIQFSGATTTTLPSLAANAMNKVVNAQFSFLTHYRWFERIVQVEPNDGSVQNMRWITFGGIQNLPIVDEKSAYTELDVDDVDESSPFVKRGGYVGITLEMIRNSQIQRIRGVPRALAIAAVRTRSSAVSSIFTANAGVGPTLSQDSKALFHTDHGNLLTTAFGTDATAWRAARAECYKHAEVGSSKRLAVFPRFWIGPADLYDTALSVFGYGEGMPTVYSPEAEGRGFADPRPIPIVSPDFTDTNDWAYLVDPQVYPVIQMSYAQAPGGSVHPAPDLWSAVSETGGLLFSNDVIAVKVRDWFAVGVNGPRGIGKRNVT